MTTTADDMVQAVIQTASNARVASCIHPGLFSTPGDLNATHHCPTCQGDIPNRDL